MRKNPWAWSVSTGQIWCGFLIGLFCSTLVRGQYATAGTGDHPLGEKAKPRVHAGEVICVKTEVRESQGC